MITTTKKAYIKIFDKKCKTWRKDPEANLMLLKWVENQSNELLKNRGYVFLRDIYEILGIPLDMESVTHGWFYDKKTYYWYGQIEFDIYQTDNDIKINFLNVENIMDNF